MIAITKIDTPKPKRIEWYGYYSEKENMPKVIIKKNNREVINNKELSDIRKVYLLGSH